MGRVGTRGTLLRPEVSPSAVPCPELPGTQPVQSCGGWGGVGRRGSRPGWEEAWGRGGLWSPSPSRCGRRGFRCWAGSPALGEWRAEWSLREPGRWAHAWSLLVWKPGRWRDRHQAPRRGGLSGQVRMGLLLCELHGWTSLWNRGLLFESPGPNWWRWSCGVLEVVQGLRGAVALGSLEVGPRCGT